jgi:glycosyltransferase involved in cell wall biosynthesis
MKHLLYIANMRFPTEKAHGLQIAQNCEAFADVGLRVTLWFARRFNTREMRAVADPFAYYTVKRSFSARAVPCIDLMPLVPNQNNFVSRLIFLLQAWSFTMIACFGALFTPADIYYSRDLSILLLLSLFKPRRALVYEAHRRMNASAGRWLQSAIVRRVGTIIPVTAKLGEELIALGADSARVQVAHDGIRRERFANLPDQAQARQHAGWPADAFIVGYVGRLHTMSMDKGVGTLVEALKAVEGASLALVGGPDDMAEVLRRQWRDAGLAESRFLYAGHVLPEEVPLYLSAFDVCAMPFPWTEHFAYHASPLKLFEYMASGRAIVASDLPAFADVVCDGESALLVPPSDMDALATAIIRLRDDPKLRTQLADCAFSRVMADYTWDARARAILTKVVDGA